VFVTPSDDVVWREDQWDRLSIRRAKITFQNSYAGIGYLQFSRVRSFARRAKISDWNTYRRTEGAAANLDSQLDGSFEEMTIATGTTLGRSEIRSLLGVGGMGEVYRASDPKIGRDVAVKVLLADFSADKGTKR